MNVDGKMVQDLAALMKLSISAEEEASACRELESILRYARRMQQLALADVPPTQHIVPVENVLRPDRPGNSCTRDTMLANAPTREGEYISVPPALA